MSVPTEGAEDKSKRELGRFLRFVAVGVLNTTFGYGVFAAVWYVTMDHVIAVIVGNVIGATFNYFSTGRLVFANRGMAALIPFLLGYVLVLAGNLAIVEGLTRAGISALVAGLIALPFMVLLSYLYNSLVVFRRVPK